MLGFAWAALWWIAYRDPPVRPGETPPIARPAPRMLEILRRRRFWAIAVPRFLSEPAWQTFGFWIPLYLATERHWDLKQIALFAWAPFLAADFGGVGGGYLAPFLMRRFGLGLIDSRIAGIALGALLMIGPGCVGLVKSPYAAVALLCVGGFAHQMLSGLINTLSADVFDEAEVGTANGLVSCAGWIGGLLFSLLVGALADGIGFAPLFGALGVFDLIGVVALVILIRPFRAQPRALAA